MRLFSTHFPIPDQARPEQPPVLVPEGFSWSGLVFSWVVLLRPGSWLVAMLAGLAAVLIGLLMRVVPEAWVLLPGLHLVVALFANDWRRWELGRAGYVAGPIVAGPDQGAALLRLLDLRPDLVGSPAAAS
ncbi:hypothetical protein [Lichenicola sp.]|uniref:hypothetical protein n=1 Tax=Lichenicola sp. TaxID=2804529 RepID=UPI003AFFACE1